MLGKNRSVGKGHTKWLGGPPVAHPWSTCKKTLQTIYRAC